MRFSHLKDGIRKRVRYFHSGNMALKPDFRCAYKQVDDCLIYADVYVPPAAPSDEKRKCPVSKCNHRHHVLHPMTHTCSQQQSSQSMAALSFSVTRIW